MVWLLWSVWAGSEGCEGAIKSSEGCRGTLDSCYSAGDGDMAEYQVTWAKPLNTLKSLINVGLGKLSFD